MVNIYDPDTGEFTSGFQVLLIEHERNWGVKVDEIKTFGSIGEAEAFISKFNSKNTEETVPDWYMVAERGW